MTELVTFTTYEAMIAAFKARRIELGMSQLAVDQAAGLPDGYCSKVEMSISNPTARNARAIGRESMPLLLGAVGLELSAHAGFKRASKSANETINLLLVRVREFTTKRARKGQAAWFAKTPPAKRRSAARKAARARWAKHRKEKAATKRTRQAMVAAGETT